MSNTIELQILLAISNIDGPAEDPEDEGMDARFKFDTCGFSKSQFIDAMRDANFRLRTFKCRVWDKKILPHPKVMAEAGLFYIGFKDVVQCPFCEIVLDEWNAQDDPLEEHATHAPRCSFIAGYDVKNRAIEIDPIRGPGRRNDVLPRDVADARYAEYASRLETYHANWNNIWPKGAEELARAGFVATGKRDKVVCYECGVQIDSWKPTHNPWDEHAHVMPRCKFIRYKRINPEKVIEDWMRSPLIRDYLLTFLTEMSKEVLADTLNDRWINYGYMFQSQEELAKAIATTREKSLEI